MTQVATKRWGIGRWGLGRWVLTLMAGLIGLMALALIWVIFLGGVALTDRAMLWNMIRDIDAQAPTAEQVATALKVPNGFEITLWATELPSARILLPLPTGEILLTQPRGGLVTLLESDRNEDGRSDGRQVLLSDLDRPNGIDFHDGWLYVAEATQIRRYAFDPVTRRLGNPEVIIQGLTADGSHWRKSVRIGPDGALYLGQGSTCNVCIEADPRRATLMRFSTTGEGGRIYATGTRNPYGFDWAPWNNALFATENGRDLLGDDLPPDELNEIIDGGFYGWPHVHGRDVLDPTWAEGHDAKLTAARPPAHEFGAHVAPLGIRFLRYAGQPTGYQRTALVALHGSWNRSTPSGYAVVSLHFATDGTIDERPFVSGFRSDDTLIGRPVDVAEAADGRIYISDDYSGVVYQVRAISGPSSAGR